MNIYKLKKLTKTGFTLVEMLVTVSIASLAIVFFSQLYIGDMQRKQWDLTVNDLITLNRVVSLYYIDNEGLWPGEVEPLDSGCANEGLVRGALNAYLPVFDLQYMNSDTDTLEARYVFGCNGREFTVSTRFLANVEASTYIASGLPIARVNGDEVAMHVIKPRMQYATNVKMLEAEIDPIDSYVEFAQNGTDITCANKQISVQPLGVCVGDQEDLGGYRVDVRTVNDNWVVTVLVRTDEDDATFEPIHSCSDGGTEVPITVQALVFCQD